MPRTSRTDPLRTYNQRRDFGATAEPRGVGPKAKATKAKVTKARGAKAEPAEASALGFVVQKHDATRLHYDFRLEHDGVLWSWAVPKGPSLDPAVKRLAARTEDHPLDYADFEGVIPAGHYGGGPVIVWDRGVWVPEADPAAGMAKGHLRFRLEGEKIRGGFHLVRTKGDKESWLLFKSDDEHARPGSDVIAELPASVKTGRKIEAVRAGEEERELPRTSAAAADAIVEALAGLDLGVALTNLDKVLYPELKLTKGQLIAYYASVAEPMLRFVGGRPLSLLRCPDGRGGQCFFQKNATSAVPPAVHRVSGADGTTMYVDDVAGLVALGQMGVLEVHTWMSHIAKLEAPDEMVIDLDPDEKLPASRVIEAALTVRRELTALGLESFVKTTGGKGLHVVTPLTPGHDWDTHKSFAHRFVQRMEAREPDRYVTTVRKDQRRGKILLDYLRNGRGSTAVAPYSPRARPGAPVATPIAWSELEGVKALPVFTFDDVLERIRGVSVWAEMSSVKQRLTKRIVAAVER